MVHRWFRYGWRHAFWIIKFRLAFHWWTGPDDRWYPIGWYCNWRGHGDETWYDGPWCGRCGAELED